MKTTLRNIALAAAIISCLFALTDFADARSRCDGFHRCRCGVTAARKHGLKLAYNGHNLKRADEWPEAFPRAAAPYVGAVVFQGVGANGHAHVSTIVALGDDHCWATVYDDAGTYKRNICRRGAVLLAVN